MKKERMTIEELRTLKLPVTLECDDGWYTGAYKKITVHYVGKERLFITQANGVEISFVFKHLEHYPSLKPEPRYEILYECLDKFFNVTFCCEDGRHFYSLDNRKKVLCSAVFTRIPNGRTLKLNLDTWEIE